jgi:eukaryotic-like serine/threonine-protein kinase
VSASEVASLTAALAGRYTIEREIGRGGMAAVYLARDLRHERNVAVKVLNQELGAIIGVDRFLSEIRVTANLQHPHLLPLFDSGEANGLLFYVMPFVEGESLRARLDRERQLPVDETVRIATAVASALDYAHERGIIHRDLKPENILLQAGHPVVADFGIALAITNAGGARITQTGLSLGTPQYMSPEQAAGDRALDGRTDIYALGAVTYEMLVGDPPHDAGTVQAIVAKVLTEKPAPVRARRDTVPAYIDAAIATALAKLPADRFSTAGAFADALTRPRVVPAPTAPRLRAATLGAGAVALVALGVVVGRSLAPRAESSSPTLRLSFPTAADAPLSSTTARALAITPRGDAVVYVGEGPSGRSLYVRRLDSDSVVALPGTLGATSVLVSGDGSRVLYETDGQSRMATLRSGGSIAAPGLSTLWFAQWLRNDTLLFSDTRGDLSRVPATGGTPTVIVPRDSAGQGFFITDLLPDGRTALGVLIPIASSDAVPLMTLDLATKRATALMTTPVYEGHYGGGTLVWVRDDGSVHGALFDPDRKTLIGRPVSLGISVTCQTGVCHLAIADNGTMAYAPRLGAELVVVGRDGSARPVTDARWLYHRPKFSPDGRRIAVDFTSATGRDVWIADLDQHTLQRATFTTDGHEAGWDADGRTFTYLSARGGPLRMYRIRPGSPAPVDSMFFGAGLNGPGVWMPRQRALVATWTNARPGTGLDIVTLRDSAGWQMTPLLATPFEEGWPDVSPDGRWLAFASNESGRYQVYLQPLGGGERVQISTDGGSEPIWSPSGTELFYRGSSPGGEVLIAAQIGTAPALRVVARQTLFSTRSYDTAAPHANYDVAPDGKSFVFIRRPNATQIMVIQNVQELVRRVAP